MMTIKKHIPNSLTLMNIACGFIAIVFAIQGDILTSFYFIIGASFFDFIDGAIARLLNVQSEIGKELDSLCDVVSFGVAPGMILFYLMKNTLGISGNITLTDISIAQILLLILMATIPAFSALRLAKFNLDTKQTESFIGLPVPANALLISSLGALYTTNDYVWINNLLEQPTFLVVISISLAYLLISPLPMFALKFKNFKLKDNKIRYIFIILSLLSIISFGISGITIAIIAYISISIIIRLSKQ